MSWPTDPLDVRCVFAFGASLSAAPTSWVFTDCSADLRVAEEVNIKVGRSDRARQPEPNQATFSMNNANGQYTVDNPVGANYPNVVENVPGIVAVRQNLNPTFEVDASDWTAVNGTFARSTAHAFSGVASGLFTPTGGNRTAGVNVTALIPVRPNGAVYVDAWVYSPTGWANVNVSASWYDNTNTLISSTAGPNVSVPAATWTYLGAYIGAAPSNTASVAGQVVMANFPGATNTLWIDEARTSIPRLCGFVDGWTPGFNSTGSVATVAVSMSGARRRLGRGNPPLRSALVRSTLGATTAPLAYWPIEDGSSSIQAANAVVGGLPLTAVSGVNLPSFSSVNAAPGSAQLPNFSVTNGSSLTGPVPISNTGSWSFSCVINLGTATGTSAFIPVYCTTTDGGVWGFQVNAPSSRWGMVYAVNSSVIGTIGATPTFASTLNPFDGNPHIVRVTAVQSGADVSWHLIVDDSFTIDFGFVFSLTLTPLSQVLVNSTAAPSPPGPPTYAVGHVTAYNLDVPSIPSMSTAMRGWSGETAGARITRLCAEQGVQLTTVNDQALSIPMGAQTPISFLDLLLECETADLGMMFEPFDGFGFGYLVRSDLYNLPVTLTIDHSQTQLAPPFAPLHDDLQRQNDVTASRPGGSSARFIGDTSRGLYQDSPTVNVAADSQLLDVAAWRVHLGSPRKRLRHPSLSVNFTNATATALAAVFTASLGLGIRTQVVNPPSQITVPPDLLVSGYTEKLGFKQWIISLLGSPYEVWRVFTIADAVLGRIETDGSALSGGPYASGATSLTVTSSGGVWDTTATPFDVDIGGEQCTATAIVGSTSPQTFTVTRSVNGVVKQQTAGTPVALWRPGVIAL